MLVKQAKGRDFYSCVAYVLHKAGAKPLDGNMLGQTAVELTAEFEQLASLRTGVKRRLYHCSLSLPTGEHLDDASWCRLSEDYLVGMGFKGHQYLVVRHTDTPSHEHVHIVANRVGRNGAVTEDSWDAYRAQVVAKALEQQYGLTPTPTSWQSDRKALSQRQLAKEKQTGIPSIQRQLQDTVGAVIPQSDNFADFTDRLRDQGITLKVSYGYADQPIGLSYCQNGVTMSGSSLGRGYSWEGIQQRLGQPSLEAHPVSMVRQVRSDLINLIDETTADRPTLPELLERLQKSAITAHIRYKRAKGRKPMAEAISFSQGTIVFPGETLGTEYHLKGLQASLRVDYQPQRDDAWIQQWQAAQAGNSKSPGASPKKSQTFEKKVAPQNITQLEPHQVYVFGASLDGIHETGVALEAFGHEARQRRKCEPEATIGQWAIWGQGQGYQQGSSGNGYAIAIKPKWTSKQSLPLAAIAEQVDQLIEFAQAHPEQEFLFSRFQDKAMVKIWQARTVPENVRLPEHWQKQVPPVIPEMSSARHQRRVVISGDAAAQFNHLDRQQAIGQLARGIEATFREAQAQGLAAIQFVSDLTPGVAHWGAVAALHLREQQVNQAIPAVPKIEVVAAIPYLEVVQGWGKAAIAQSERVIAMLDRVESNPDVDYLTTVDDRLLLVEMVRRKEDSRLQREALSRNIPIHKYTVDNRMKQQVQR